MDVYLFILYECSYNIHWNRPKRHMLANKSIGKSEQKRSNHKKKWRNELQFRRIFIAQHMENETWIQSETTIYTYRYINIRIYTLIYASEYCAIGAVVFFFLYSCVPLHATRRPYVLKMIRTKLRRMKKSTRENTVAKQ